MDQQIEEWHQMAQSQLKKKIKDNLKKRAENSAEAINYAINHIIHDTQSNHIWSALFPTKSIDLYHDMVPSFVVPPKLIENALNELFKKVDSWKGCKIISMSQKPKDYKKYWTTSDNWWNRYKAQWIGDRFLCPLLQNALYEYIKGLTAKYTTSQYNNKSVINPERIEYEQHITNELLYFVALQNILHSEVSFKKSRAQPLILDQSYQKSEKLQQFFFSLGNKHGIDWSIPPNTNKKQNRLHIRQYARKWVQNVLERKQTIYNMEVMRLINVNNLKLSTSPKPLYTAPVSQQNTFSNIPSPIFVPSNNIFPCNARTIHHQSDYLDAQGVIYTKDEDDNDIKTESDHIVYANKYTPRPFRRRPVPKYNPISHPFQVPFVTDSNGPREFHTQRVQKNNNNTLNSHYNMNSNPMHCTNHNQPHPINNNVANQCSPDYTMEPMGCPSNNDNEPAFIHNEFFPLYSNNMMERSCSPSVTMSNTMTPQSFLFTESSFDSIETPHLSIFDENKMDLDAPSNIFNQTDDNFSL